MTDPTEAGNAQAALWNGVGGQGWVAVQAITDRVFKPFEDLLVEATGTGRRVLDVGCGSGVTTVAIARRLGDAGACTGIDVSEPLLAAARQRAEAAVVDVRFVQADAQRHAFEAARFDTVVSRFGVMFFDDFIEAFANLGAATAPGGTLRVVTWRSPSENPFMTTTERAAAPLVTLPPRDPDGPGQFALADADRVHHILDNSGWTGVEMEPLDVVCTMSEEDLVPYLTHLGPLARALADEDPATKARVIDAVRPAFDPYVDGDQIRFTAACWLVSASR